MGKEKRLEIRLTADERAFIEEKMTMVGISNMSAYLRKMAMDGYIVNVDMTEIKTLVKLMSSISSNVNQIARRSNETGGIFTPDLEDLQANYEKLTRELMPLITKLMKL